MALVKKVRVPNIGKATSPEIPEDPAKDRVYYVRVATGEATPYKPSGLWEAIPAKTSGEAERLWDSGLRTGDRGTGNAPVSGPTKDTSTTATPSQLRPETVAPAVTKGVGNLDEAQATNARSTQFHPTVRPTVPGNIDAAMQQNAQGANPRAPGRASVNSPMSPMAPTAQPLDIRGGNADALKNVGNLGENGMDPNSLAATFEDYPGNPWFKKLGVTAGTVNALDPTSPDGQRLILRGILTAMGGGAQNSSAPAYLEDEMKNMGYLSRILGKGGLSQRGGTGMPSPLDALAGMEDITGKLLNTGGGTPQYVNPDAILRMGLSQIQNDKLSYANPEDQMRGLSQVLNAVSPYVDEEYQQALATRLQNWMDDQMLKPGGTLSNPTAQRDSIADLLNSNIF